MFAPFAGRLDLSTAPLTRQASAGIHLLPTAEAYAAALTGLTAENQLLLSRGGYPRIYSAGVVYHTEPRDTWRHVSDVITHGWGDCEDLAAWRAAELVITGEDIDARVFVYRSGPHRFHAVVMRGSGVLEDPSRALGMHWKPTDTGIWSHDLGKSWRTS